MSTALPIPSMSGTMNTRNPGSWGICLSRKGADDGGGGGFCAWSSEPRHSMAGTRSRPISSPVGGVGSPEIRCDVTGDSVELVRRERKPSERRPAFAGQEVPAHRGIRAIQDAVHTQLANPLHHERRLGARDTRIHDSGHVEPEMP